MNKVAFVSGASRGIGQGIADSLAHVGYDLALCCNVNIEKLQKFATELSVKYGVRARSYQLDVSDENAWNEVAPSIIDDFGQIDVVINNVGISYVGLITDMTSDEWHKMIATNVDSLYYSTRAFLPAMIKRKSGYIINISSMWGSLGASCEVAYSASKGAVNAYTKALAKEVAPSGIAVNAISCGVIDTDMNSWLSPEESSALIDEIPAGRMGTPEEIGNVIVSLLQSPTYMTGQIIGVDGGI